MSFIKTATSLLLLSYGLNVAAHGIVKTLVVDGQFVQGYDVGFSYQPKPPVVAGWSIPTDRNLGFVDNVKSPDIICHVGATPGGTHATVKAGGKIEFQWTKWPHDGPMITYMANCNGPCESVDKTKLKFFKIDEAGLLDARPALPQGWATDVLKANNNSWTVTVPTKIAPGFYVVRHETIALHAAENSGGAQFYPQCINFEVTGSGTDNPDGVLGTDLYNAEDPGIHFNMYYPVPKAYVIPGPKLYAGAVGTNQGGAMPITSSSGTAASNTTVSPYSNSSSYMPSVVAPQSYTTDNAVYTLSQKIGTKPSGVKPIRLSHLSTVTCTHTTMVEDTVDATSVTAAAAATAVATTPLPASSGSYATASAAEFASPTTPAVEAEAETTPSPTADSITSTSTSYVTTTLPVKFTAVVLPIIPSVPAASKVYSIPMPSNSLLPVNTTTATNLTNISINTTAIHNHTTHRPHFNKGQLPKNLTATYEAPPLPANASWDDFWAWVVEVVEGGWFFKSSKGNGEGGEEPSKFRKRHARDFGRRKAWW